jgi:hypothetical protein
MSLRDLEVNIRLIFKIEDLSEGSVKGIRKEPFKLYREDKNTVCYLPNNYKELIKKSYLYELYVGVLEMEGYKFALLPETGYQSKFLTQQSMEAVLKGFGIILCNKVIPELPKSNKSLYSKGIFCALKHYYSTQNNFDPKFWRFRKAAHLSTYILKDVWGKNYPVEKYIIDQLISILRKRKFQESNLHTYLLPNETIRDENGLNLKKVSSDLFTEGERALIDLYTDSKLKTFRVFKIAKFSNQISFDFGAIKYEVQSIQDMIRHYKKSVKIIEDDRLRAVYTSMTARDKQKKQKDSNKDSY